MTVDARFARDPRDRQPATLALLLLVSVTVAALALTPRSAHAARSSDEPAATATSDLESRVSTESTWRRATADSLRLLVAEHATRVAFQDKTRRELRGPFLRDYVRSVKVPRTWEDGDSWGTNYIGHPIHGAASGFIWLDHEDGRRGGSGDVPTSNWRGRGRAVAWAAAYSVQFEFGPLSEASIGNVGLRPGTTGWVDHIVTPAGAFGFMVAEDALDRHLVTRVELWTANPLVRVLSRMALNPSRTLSNAAQGRSPWHRSRRPLRDRP